MLDGGNWTGPDAGEPYAPTLVPRTPPWTSGEFLRALHPPGSRGKVSLLAKCGGVAFARCFPADEIEPILPVWTETTSYVGLNRDFGPRGVDPADRGTHLPLRRSRHLPLAGPHGLGS